MTKHPAILPTAPDAGAAAAAMPGGPAAAAKLAFQPGYTPAAARTFFQCGANMRTNRWAKARITAQIRNDAKNLAASQKLPRFTGPVTILAVQHPALRGRAHDAENIAPLVKAAIDGLRDAGVLINDSPRYVAAVAYAVGERVERVERGQLVLHISPVTEGAEPVP
jgi:crossover junction endodeoxyribonuclease RusA